jgi:hypothetical protein
VSHQRSAQFIFLNGVCSFSIALLNFYWPGQEGKQKEHNWAQLKR